MDLATTISRRCLASFLFMITAGFVLNSLAQKPRVPPGGHLAIVADERLAALRGSPDPAARLIRRLSRGRFVSIRGSRTHDGLTFYQVAINRRTSGWLQSEAVISSWRAGDDERLTRLLDGADELRSRGARPDLSRSVPALTDPNESIIDLWRRR